MTPDAPARPPLRRLWDRTPRWARLALASVALILGIVVMTRPTVSLGVLALLIGAGAVLVGVLDLADAARRPDEDSLRRTSAVLAVLWIAAGLFVLVFPGLTVRLVAVLVGIGLILSGAVGVVRAFRRGRTADERIADGAFGGSGVFFGVLALSWPDITLLIVSVVFGARLIIGALSLAWHSLRGTARTQTTRPGPVRRWATAGVAIVTVLAAVGAGVVSVSLSSASPVVDDFYAAPRDVPEAPGHLVRSEPFTRGVPDEAKAWRILYTTTTGDGAATTASAIVVVPRRGSGSWPVIDWNHGTTGFARNCAPSLAAEPFESGALFVLPEVVEEGWALVAPDYIGLGGLGPHPYLIGRDSAHAGLDAVRAARTLTEADLGEKTVVWGHSQGGGAALWTGALAHDYAPDVPLSGVAALAPAANLPALVGHLPDVTGGSIFASFAFAAYAAEYPDVTWRRYIRPGAEGTVRAMSERCLAEPGSLVSVLDVLGLSRDPRIFAVDPGTGPFRGRLEQNVPPAIPEVPVLLAQGAADSLIVPSAQREYVERVCADGAAVDYRTYYGLDHIPLVEASSPLIPDLIRWTADRFGGSAPPSGCTISAG